LFVLKYSLSCCYTQLTFIIYLFIYFQACELLRMRACASLESTPPLYIDSSLLVMTHSIRIILLARLLLPVGIKSEGSLSYIFRLPLEIVNRQKRRLIHCESPLVRLWPSVKLNQTTTQGPKCSFYTINFRRCSNKKDCY